MQSAATTWHYACSRQLRRRLAFVTKQNSLPIKSDTSVWKWKRKNKLWRVDAGRQTRLTAFQLCLFVSWQNSEGLLSATTNWFSRRSFSSPGFDLRVLDARLRPARSTRSTSVWSVAKSSNLWKTLINEESSRRATWVVVRSLEADLSVSELPSCRRWPFEFSIADVAKRPYGFLNIKPKENEPQVVVTSDFISFTGSLGLLFYFHFCFSFASGTPLLRTTKIK